MRKRHLSTADSAIDAMLPKAPKLAASALVWRSIADLHPNPRNPRMHSRRHLRDISRSYDSYGFTVPILVDKENNIIAGHGRYEAAKLYGYTEVPTLCLAHLSKAEAHTYMLTDNKLSDGSEWDDHKLAVLLKELSIEIPGIEVPGFEIGEIDFLIQSLDSPDAMDMADEFSMPGDTAVSQTGDLWYLNEHIICCGNALESMSYSALFENEKASAVFTDPPYNVKIDGHVCGSGAIKHREFAMASGEMSPAQYTTFLSSSLSLIGSHSIAGAVIYCCMDWRHMDELSAAGKIANFELLNLCVWAKANGGLGSFYRSRHELVFVFRNGSAPHRNNVQLGRFGRNRTNVWNYPGTGNFDRKGRKKALELHPTIKPIAMVADAILDSTKTQDIVLDPFIGSGTTLLACEKTGRRCVGIELDPLYIDTVIQRWEKLTGNKARHSNGETFDSLAFLRRAEP